MLRERTAADALDFITYGNENELYITDVDEGLTFVREKVGENKYSLVVIIEEHNVDFFDGYSMCTDIMSPSPPCGFQIFDNITLKEWTKLAYMYIRKKREGRKWLKDNFYSHLGRWQRYESLLIESSPPPGDTRAEEEFVACWDRMRNNGILDFYEKAQPPRLVPSI